MTDEVKPIILVMTVGGSPEPLASALRIIRPEFAYFLVSAPTQNSESSKSQIVNETLYNFNGTEIGTGLAYRDGCPPKENTSIIEIAPDDADLAYKQCRLTLGQIRKQYPNHHIIADYTGGTKTMTGALLMASFAQDGIEVQFMSGERLALDKIRSGSEKPQTMSPAFILAERDYEKIKQTVATYDFESSHRLANKLFKIIERNKKIPSVFRKKVKTTQEWLDILSKWDKFQHKDAAHKARSDFDSDGPIYNALKNLNIYDGLINVAEKSGKQSNWALCADLWLNAQRRAATGRYDDAIARLYRLLEAVIQARLFEYYKIPNPIPWDVVPSDILGSKKPFIDKESQRKCAPLGLDGSVDLIKHLNPNDDLVAVLLNDEGKPQYSWTLDRNNSILAHGFKTLKIENWNAANIWVNSNLRKFWVEHEPPQLPNEIPNF